MNNRTLKAALVAASCLIGLAACAGPTDTAFPAPDLATTPDGTFPNLDQLRMVEPGMTKAQVYPLIGPPHFHESVFHVRVWNYLFRFRDAEDSKKALTCEYQIQFDAHGRITRTRWQDQACERFAPAKIAAGVDDSPSTTEKVQ
ncbi:outer membrane protein assembly factor BamE [Trinickia diaoshuihuensis]|uniref:outer membrane protein assembly factor BamE n=1 Tax=Trinickia diaoshuihuensis TaxID=2292265 RepID=UPI000E26C161|nr:outer membrane protein assembly factor BamE [Trinickia diaoshuihuensis]